MVGMPPEALAPGDFAHLTQVIPGRPRPCAGEPGIRTSARRLIPGPREDAWPGMTGWIHGARAFGVLVKSTSGHCWAGSAHSLPVIRSTAMA